LSNVFQPYRHWNVLERDPAPTGSDGMMELFQLGSGPEPLNINYTGLEADKWRSWRSNTALLWHTVANKNLKPDVFNALINNHQHSN